MSSFQWQNKRDKAVEVLRHMNPGSDFVLATNAGMLAMAGEFNILNLGHNCISIVLQGFSKDTLSDEEKEIKVLLEGGEKNLKDAMEKFKNLKKISVSTSPLLDANGNPSGGEANA